MAVRRFMMNGVELIAQERKRQIEAEGWTKEHDDTHEFGELAIAGACYALTGYTLTDLMGSPIDVDGFINDLWPWDDEWYKPKDRLRNLVRAGALIAAEIDRIQNRG